VRQAASEEVAMKEQAADKQFDERRHEVDGELTFTLNLLDRVEDDTRRLYWRMLKETQAGRDTN
jgi:uncharacterized membrane-anchored protein YhcB (DUF1043 family)